MTSRWENNMQADTKKKKECDEERWMEICQDRF